MSLTQINKAGLDEIALDHVFTIGALGNYSAYTFQGGTGGHPIRIQSTSGASGTAYNTGVTNNASAGTVIVEVQHDAPDILYYQCTSHAAMNGILYITGALADGGVTTAKIADDAVDNDKLANSVVASIAANTAKTTNATHTGDVTGSTSLTIATGAVTEAKIANNAVTTNKIANNAVTTDKILDDSVTPAKISGIPDNSVNSSNITDQAVTLAKLPHGTSSNDGKFLRANNGADPTFESIPASGISNLVEDTTPQLGGNLDTNSHNILLDDNHYLYLGDTQDASLFNTGTYLFLKNYDGGVAIQGTTSINLQKFNNSDIGLKYIVDGAVEIYHDNSKKFQTQSDGVEILSTGSWHGLEVKHSNGNVVAKLQNKGSGDEGYFALYDSGGTGPSIQMDGEHGRLTCDQIRIGGNADANQLDDYEEGTFSAPYYQGGTFLANGDGRYTKVGNRVFISIFEFVSGQSTKQDKDILYITGLPFSARSEPNSLGTIARYGGGNHQTIGTAEHCYIAQGGTQIKFDDTFNSGTGNWTVSLVYEAS